MANRQSLSASQCADLIRNSSRVAALTGAGISTTAGIPDFRGPEGLYVTRRYDPEAVFDIWSFHRDPEPFFDFTRDFLSTIHSIEPTLTHRFLADLEQDRKLTAVVTQNIDSLHQKAGSRNVVSVHGDYWKSHCLVCAAIYDLGYMEQAITQEKVPLCTCGGVIKPDVVFFGETVKSFERASNIVKVCDLLFVLGSSLAVYPASMLPEAAGGKVVVVNKGEVSLGPGPTRYFVDADLDSFFSSVADKM